MKAPLTLGFILIALFSYSQTITGQFTDSSGKRISYVSVTLNNTEDSAMVQFALSDQKGHFALSNLDSGSYLLIAAAFGYDVLHYPLNLSSDVHLDLSLKINTVSLDEVLVEARRIPIMIHGDTVIYNADNFAVQGNATIEDLLQKLPGIVVNKDGSISTEGQGVTKVLINGKEFFGGNVQAATKNLDADLVEKIEVIDRKTEDDDFVENEDGEREKVINVVLKEEHSKGYFGTLRAGAGTQEYYDLHGNINFFNETAQLSIIGGMNNMDQRLYGWQDMSTLQTFEIQPFNNDSRTTWWNSGISTNKGVGANLHLNPTKKLQIDMSYVLTDERSVGLQNSDKEVYLPTSTIFSSGRSEDLGDNGKHQFNNKIEFEPDSLNRIVFRAQFSMSKSNALSTSREFNFREVGSYINSGVNRDRKDNVNENFASKIHWTSKRKKNSKDHLLASLYFGYNDLNDNVNSYFNTQDSVLLPYPSLEQSTLNQALTTGSRVMATTLAYEKEINSWFSIRPGVNYSYSQYDHNYDWTTANDERIESLSPTGDVQGQNIEYYTHLIFQLDSFSTLRIVPEFNQTIESRQFNTDTNYNYSFNQVYFIPYIFFRSSKQHDYNFRFFLTADIERPSVTNLLPITDNSNPYLTTIGNIELKNNMRYSNSWSYSKSFSLGKSLNFYGWNTLTLNPVTNSSFISEDNYRVSAVLNYKHRVYSYHSVQFLLPVKKIKARMTMALSLGYSESFFIRNQEDLKVINTNPNAEIGLSWNEFETIDFGFDYTYSPSFGAIGGESGNNYVSHSFGTELGYRPSKRFDFNTEFMWEINGASSAVDRTSVAIWNAGLNYFIDKKSRWGIGLRAFDILDQNQRIWRWWSANSFMQQRSNAVTRNIMLSLTYKIKNPKRG